MADHLRKVDCLEYLGLYKDRSDRPQVTWLELEEHFNRLVAKYTARWPGLATNIIKYSALFRLIESYWGTDEHLPPVDEFSLQTIAWPRDTGPTGVETRSRHSADGKASIQTPQSAIRLTGGAMGIENQTARELCEAAEALSQVSIKISKVFN